MSNIKKFRIIKFKSKPIFAAKSISKSFNDRVILRKIDISLNDKLGENFVRNLSERLLEWTGKRWVITLSKKEGNKTFSELQSIEKNEILEKEKKGEVYKKFKNVFSDGSLIKVSKED